MLWTACTYSHAVTHVACLLNKRCACNTSDGTKRNDLTHTQNYAEAVIGTSLQTDLSHDQYVNMKHTKYTLKYKINCEVNGISAFIEEDGNRSVFNRDTCEWYEN